MTGHGPFPQNILRSRGLLSPFFQIGQAIRLIPDSGNGVGIGHGIGPLRITFGIPVDKKYRETFLHSQTYGLDDPIHRLYGKIDMMA
jgi:hypothetical protein